MKKLLTTSLVLSVFAGTLYAEKMNANIANFITFESKSGQSDALASFLTKGGKLIKKTEPKTLLWSALQNKNGFVIFDTFHDEDGRSKHFSGQVAKALKDGADKMIVNGWDNGILKSLNSAKVLVEKVSKKPNKDIKKLVFVRIKAQKGKEKELAELLIACGKFIKFTEPQTRHSYALQFSKNEFGILNFFTDKSGIKAHAEGPIVSALKMNGSRLIEGGFKEGLKKNIKVFDVLKLITQSKKRSSSSGDDCGA